MSNEQRVQNGAWHIARVREHVKTSAQSLPSLQASLQSSEPGGSVPFFTFLTTLGLLVPWHCFDLHLSPSDHWKLRASRAGWGLLCLFTFGAEQTRPTAGPLSMLAGPNASPCFPLSVSLSVCLLLSLCLPPYIGMVSLGHKSWPTRRM